MKPKLEIHEVEQGSGLWLEARAGKATASAFNKIVTAAKLLYSAQADGYEDRCVAELLTGEPIEDFKGTVWMERGKELEAEARAAYTFQTGRAVETVGFISRGMFGFSPDGMIGRRIEWLKGIGRGMELKCPGPQQHVGLLKAHLRDPKWFPDEYKMQVQGSLWVSGFAAWDFMSYHPKLPPLILEVLPDAAVQAALDAAAEKFEANVKTTLAEIRAMMGVAA